jgi:hypothetical protein
MAMTIFMRWFPYFHFSAGRNRRYWVQRDKSCRTLSAKANQAACQLMEMPAIPGILNGP